jgi:hypothetical protein
VDLGRATLLDLLTSVVHTVAGHEDDDDVDDDQLLASVDDDVDGPDGPAGS